ncbi:MAG: mutarotase [Bacteroidota bacterium]
MNLKVHYDQLYRDSIQKIQADAYQVDKLIDSEHDTRFGLTLLVRPDKATTHRVQQVLSKIRAVEPQQYYYRDADLHVTVMSIISCYEGFTLGQIKVEEYVDTIQKSIQGVGRFDIEFRGLTASPSCLMVQGFFTHDTLDRIRDNLRANFSATNLEQTLDKRYPTQTAHSTIFRLKETLANKEQFLEIVDTYRDFHFGTLTVDTLELVYNDWYQRRERVKVLHRFELR